MKRQARGLAAILAAGVLFSLSPAFAANQAAPGVSEKGPVAFNVTIADLHRAAQSGDDRSIPGDRVLVIDAEIGSITNRADAEDTFTAEVELVGGAWHGEERVELFRAYVVFDSPKFRDAFSRRSATRMLPGDRLIVLCRYLGLGVDYDEKTPVAVLEAFDFRRTQ